MSQRWQTVKVLWPVNWPRLCSCCCQPAVSNFLITFRGENLAVPCCQPCIRHYKDDEGAEEAARERKRFERSDPPLVEASGCLVILLIASILLTGIFTLVGLLLVGFVGISMLPVPLFVLLVGMAVIGALWWLVESDRAENARSAAQVVK